MDKRVIRKVMPWLLLAVTGLTVLVRAWLLPLMRDSDTGLFASGSGIVIALSVAAVLFAVLTYFSREALLRVSVRGSGWLAVAALVAGGMLLVDGLMDMWIYAGSNIIPQPEPATLTFGTRATAVLQILSCAVSGGAMVHLGLKLVSQGQFRPGLAGWSMLAPVVWTWLRLARYEMSYVSAVRLSQGFFDVMMFGAELLFLFYFCRYMAGVGKPAASMLRFFACLAALFALSAPLVRLVLYFLGDGEAYRASTLPCLSDAAVGLLALTTVFVSASDAPLQSEAEEESPSEGEVLSSEEEEPAMPDDASLELDSEA